MKTRARALWLAACAVLALTLTSAIENIAIPYLLKQDIRVIIANPEALNQPANVVALILVTLFLIGALIAMGAFWLDRFFGAAYFDRRAPWRWALFGALFAVWLQAPRWFFPGLGWGWKVIFDLLGAFAVFFLARRLIPLE